MHTENKHIESILKGCLDEKRDAQKLLYREFHAYAMSICLRYAENRDDAVEIMNDGFLKVFKYLKSFDWEKPFKTWLRKIMINSALDHFKKHQQKLEQLEMEAGLRELVKESQLDLLSYEDLLDLIRKLPIAYRTVFNLYAIEGYKHEEIAEMLGISEGTSKSNYHKAKKKLQELLKIYFEVNE